MTRLFPKAPETWGFMKMLISLFLICRLFCKNNIFLYKVCQVKKTRIINTRNQHCNVICRKNQTVTQR